MNKEINLLRGCHTQTLMGDRICNPSSCNKLNVHNFLKDLPQNETTPDVVEIRFKNTRKGFYHNVNALKLNEGDLVAVEASPGHDIGTVSLVGELVREQMRVKRVRHTEEMKKVYRKAKDMDLEKFEKAIDRENEVMLRTRQIAKRLELDMKIGDVEFQGDGSKAIFYYIADGRVDFRQLIKSLADEFKIRVEMRQIGARQEAGRIGGIGSCGRELCCASWMSNFISVSTDTARDQELSLNPQKLAGQCGKLKCCLNFEQDAYVDAKKDFPEHTPLQTQEGTAYYFKTDVHKQTIWYSFEEFYPKNVTGVQVERVHEVIEMNKNGIKPEKLANQSTFNIAAELSYTHDLDGSITRFDKFNKKKQKPKAKKTPIKTVQNSEAKVTDSQIQTVENKDIEVKPTEKKLVKPNRPPQTNNPNPPENQQKNQNKNKSQNQQNQQKNQNPNQQKNQNKPQQPKQPTERTERTERTEPTATNLTEPGSKKLVKKNERPTEQKNNDAPPVTE